ncbi:MAG: site-2 protease family protein [Anaerolineaceae bacterium]|nr:site-2 protease family protein [Anaerolineaceae bacterium]
MLLFGNLTPQMAVATILAVLIGMTVHEFAHNYVGYLMGDPTPKLQGRLTLDPRVHINPVGFLMFVLIGFGILGQAPINPQRMRDPRWGFLAAVAAGPLSNLLLAIVFAIPIRLMSIAPFTLYKIIFEGNTSSPTDFLVMLLGQLVFWNVLLFIFNLLPVFPIDGWHIVLALLPPSLAYEWQRHRQTTNYILLGLILLSFIQIPGLDILGMVIFRPVYSIVLSLLGIF